MAQGVSAKVNVPLSAGERSDEAASAVLLALLNVIEANLEGAIAGADGEHLHDLRVSVRRSRAVLKQLKKVFEPTGLRHFRGELRWLQRATGETRDLDVGLAEFGTFSAVVPADLQPDLDDLAGRLKQRREAAHDQMVQELRSERLTALLEGWRGYLAEVESHPSKARPDARRPIDKVAGRRIRRVYRKTARIGGGITPGSAPEQYHELRKLGKELRYLLELFGASLYPAEVVKPMIKSLKGFQDLLGRHQDGEVQSEAVRQVAEVEPPVNPALVMLLIARLDGDKLASRAAFSERFARFAEPEQRKTVKKIFR